MFQPVRISGRDFVDGGLVAPVPVRFAREMGAELVLAVDISSPPEANAAEGSLQILLQTFAIMGKTINDSVIVEPSETIVYGEKLYPIGHFFMDLLEGNLGNDNEVLNHAVHNSAVRSDRGGSANGGSNFAFADGSTRYLRYRKSLSPINLWAITPQWRTNTMN